MATNRKIHITKKLHRLSVIIGTRISTSRCLLPLSCLLMQLLKLEGMHQETEMEMATFTALRIPLCGEPVIRGRVWQEPEPQPDIGQSRIPLPCSSVRQYPLATINTSAPPTAPRSEVEPSLNFSRASVCGFSYLWQRASLPQFQLIRHFHLLLVRLPRHLVLSLHLARFCGHGLVSNGSQVGVQPRSMAKSLVLSSAKGVNWVKRSLTVLCRSPREPSQDQDYLQGGEEGGDSQSVAQTKRDTY